MPRTDTKWVAIVVAMLIASSLFILLPGQTSGTDIHRGQSEQLSPRENPLRVNITPSKETLYQNESRVFHLMLLNPSTSNESLSGFLYAGYEDRSDPPNVTIAAQSPNVRYRDVVGRHLEFNLSPGGKRVFPIHVHRGSGAGSHELNATTVYFQGWNLTRESAVASVDIEPTPCQFSCRVQRIVDDIRSWFGNNWNWMVALLSLLVAITSLLAPNRVRKFVGLSEVPTTESTDK